MSRKTELDPPSRANDLARIRMNKAMTSAVSGFQHAEASSVSASTRAAVASDDEPQWSLRCPECGGAAFIAGRYLQCPGEGRRFEKKGAVYPLLSEAREQELESFLRGYGTVRRAEGWGGDPRYYVELPFRDRSGRYAAVWKIRRRSYRLALAELESAFGKRTLRILELGAGNCWLASRLARYGHRVLATDVSLDGSDGLGAYDAYRHLTKGSVDRAQAAMESLPLGAAQFDAVIANGSLHYASDVALPLLEARRLLRHKGLLLVLDSPTYRSAGAGEAMVRRRTREHHEQHGLPLELEHQSGFLLRPDVLDLMEASGFVVRLRVPFQGVIRTMRRWLSRPAGWYPPAEFPVFIARKEPSAVAEAL